MPYQTPIPQYFQETNGVQQIEITNEVIHTALEVHLLIKSRFNPIALTLTELTAEGIDEVSAHGNTGTMFWKLYPKQKILQPYEFKYTLGKSTLQWLSDYRKFPEYPYSQYIRKGVLMIDHDNQRIDFLPNETQNSRYYDRRKHIRSIYNDKHYKKVIAKAIHQGC